MRRRIKSIGKRMRYNESEHSRLLKETTALIELALWKTQLDLSKKEYTLVVRLSKGGNNWKYLY
eukprot:scaffold6341_cov161-Skeletonema_menzelii.AAC.1